jgi:thiol:disulfide interchange protein DsbD
MQKRIILFSIVLGAAMSAIAQGSFPKPQFKATYSNTKPKAGETIDLSLKFDVAPGFHVYSEKSDCSESDGPIRASLDFPKVASLEWVGSFRGIGDHMVKETEIWNCSTGEFTGKGEFRQSLKALKNIPSYQVVFNGQICNESGCENIRDMVITVPALAVLGESHLRLL